VNREEILRLVVIEESRNDAEAIANILRNAGHAIRLRYAASREDLEAALDQSTPDLVLCAKGLESISLEEALAVATERDEPLPVIAIGDTVDEPQIIETLRTGAEDLVSFDEPEHLRLVVRRVQKTLECRKALRHYQQASSECERRCRALLDSSRDAIVYVHDGMHVYANQSYLNMFGFQELEEIEGTPILDMVAGEEHGELKKFLRNYADNDSGESKIKLKCQSQGKGTFNAVMELTAASIDGEPCTQIVIRDQSALESDFEQKLKFLSNQDPVTGLFNRQYFMGELDLAVEHASSGSGAGAMLFVLLDNFKLVKESVGLTGSDLVVSAAAKIIQDEVGDSGLAARFGDSTFTVLTGDPDAQTAKDLAERMRHAIEQHIFDVDGRSLAVTCSIGVSIIGDGAPTPREVLARADLACEVARSSGGNQVHIHDPVTDERRGQDRDEQWNLLIHKALQDNLFHLVYQPIVSLQGEASEKYEVLLRLKNEEGEDVLPGQFLPVAEQAGKTALIDLWVIVNAMSVLADRRQEGSDTVFFIKLSGSTLTDPELPLWINEQLKTLHLPADSVVFEIAETDAAQNLKYAKAFVTAISALHCKTSLEHFGSSPNSFQLLKHVDVDFLKIDGAFSHNLMSDRNNQAMIKSIIEMARSMDKQCIAESVEDAGSLSVLFQYGINYIQGYFLQEPHEDLDYDFSGEMV
jgi:diguanylate cyclase (GGDEF)-like protein/PAS domain S-box-containing protein